MRLDQLTFIRFIAAITVVIHHFGLNVFPFTNFYLNRIFQQGDLGVSFFFFLSGFVMIIAYQKKERIFFNSFIKNRIARVYPVFMFSAFLLLFYKILAGGNYLNIKGMILHLFLIHAWIPGYQLTFNIASWTLSVEMFFYIIFPFLFNKLYFKSRIKLKMIVIVWLFIWLITQLILILFEPNVFFSFNEIDFFYKEFLRLFPLMHLNQFLIGNLAALIYLNNKRNKVVFDKEIILITLIFILILLIKPNVNLFGGGLLIIFTPLTYYIAANEGLITKVFKSKYLIFLGEISYGVYILQFPINYLTNLFFKINGLNFISKEMKFYIMIFILITVSSISYLYIEKPLRKLIKSI